MGTAVQEVRARGQIRHALIKIQRFSQVRVITADLWTTLE